MITLIVSVLLLGMTLYAWHLALDRDKLQEILDLTEKKNSLLNELVDKHQLRITELENVIDKQQKVNAELCKDIQITAKNIYAELERNRLAE